MTDNSLLKIRERRVLIFPYSIGVSIQSDCASIVVLKAQFRSLRLMDQRNISLNPDKKIDENIKEVNGVLREIIRKHRISDPMINLCIPRNLSVLRFIDFPAVVKENLRETLEYEIEKHIPFVASDIYFDYQIISEVKKNSRIKVLLVAVKKEIIEPYFKIMEGIAGDLSGIDILSNAIVNFFADEKTLPSPDNLGVVYGCGNFIELSGIRKNRLWYSRWLSTSNADITSIEILSGELKAMIGKLNLHTDQEPLQVVFCVKDVSEEWIQQLRETVYANIVSVNLSGNVISDTAMIPAYGLSLKGFQAVPMDMNLLPVALQKKPSKIGLYALYGLVSLMVIFLLMWGGGHFFNKMQALNQFNASIENIQSELIELKGVALESQKIQEKIDYLNSFANHDGRLIDIANELSQRIPATAWIYNFSYSNGKVKIEGVADNASELIPLLEASPYFNGASFLSTIRKDRNGKENFSIGLDVKGSSSS